MYDYIKIPEITDSFKFENLALDLYKRYLKRIQKVGRPGLFQDGVDIYGYDENNHLIGIQCKVKSKAEIGDKKFRTSFLKEIKEEVNKAKNFSQELKEYIIMTTAPRDTFIQKEVIALDCENFHKSGFHIEIKFWDDISDMLTEEMHKNTFIKYYNNLIIREETIDSINFKILSLVVGVESRDDSLYQLILGYIPKLIHYPNGIEYYSNSYFLGCFQTRGMDTFPIRCFPSDIEAVIDCIRDRYTITDWLNSIDIDKEIQNDKREYHFYWTRDQYEEYLERFCDN
ncbi:MAG: hypothetical protein N4A57_03505 [Anaeromicrobium sp.]|jgi:hypothetical protein|uniref:hypothetical protein n=1 Tax=Anaeromicrobium sp. TaxID=1929132 RepID=UPI0025F18245|nr:hypothetical protein [Anaeromicrobium sp.]MCT4593326.1 hypothetical protein [Anaeromicrobium sp.]